MKVLKYIWAIIVNIITVAVVLGIFSVASTRFETVVLVVLVLIYLTIEGFYINWGLVQLGLAEATDEQFKAIKRLLIKEPSRETLIEESQTIDQILAIPQMTDGERKTLKKRMEKKDAIMINFYINTGFNFIIYVIALYNLLKILFNL